MKLQHLFIFAVAIILTSCGSSKSTSDSSSEQVTEKQNIDQKYKSSTLLNRITREPGVSIRGGVPVVTRSVAGKRGAPRTLQPLYIVDEQIIGRSYQSVAQIVSSAEVKEIKVIDGPEASYYGARGGYGVIKLTTFK